MTSTSHEVAEHEHSHEHDWADASTEGPVVTVTDGGVTELILS